MPVPHSIIHFPSARLACAAVVAEQTGIEIERILSRSKDAEVVYARWLYIAAFKTLTDLTMTACERVLGFSHGTLNYLYGKYGSRKEGGMFAQNVAFLASEARKRMETAVKPISGD